jgi:hypothetical protein
MYRKPVIVLAALLMALACPEKVRATRIVGLHDSEKNFYIAVRSLVPAGTVVARIQFYSNDATVFPEVLLASDQGDNALPRAGTTLRSAQAVTGTSGYVTVEFSPYVVSDDQYLWAIVRFPDNSPFVAQGSGGGPGVGCREVASENMRSLFSVDGSINEFARSFDIAMLGIDSGMSKAAATEPDRTPQPTMVPQTLTVETRRPGSGIGTTLLLGLPHPGHLVVDLFTITGQHLVQLADRNVVAGQQDLTWSGVNSEGRRVASGVYLYRARFDGSLKSGRFTFIH